VLPPRFVTAIGRCGSVVAQGLEHSKAVCEFFRSQAMARRCLSSPTAAGYLHISRRLRGPAMAAFGMVSSLRRERDDSTHPPPVGAFSAIDTLRLAKTVYHSTSRTAEDLGKLHLQNVVDLRPSAFTTARSDSSMAGIPMHDDAVSAADPACSRVRGADELFGLEQGKGPAMALRTRLSMDSLVPNTSHCRTPLASGRRGKVWAADIQRR